MNSIINLIRFALTKKSHGIGKRSLHRTIRSINQDTPMLSKVKVFNEFLNTKTIFEVYLHMIHKLYNFLITLQGLPAAIQLAGISPQTTEPAPITE